MAVEVDLFVEKPNQLAGHGGRQIAPVHESRSRLAVADGFEEFEPVLLTSIGVSWLLDLHRHAPQCSEGCISEVITWSTSTFHSGTTPAVLASWGGRPADRRVEWGRFRTPRSALTA